jgi:hypothetical protein
MRFLENYTVPERHSWVVQAEAAVSSDPASSNLLANPLPERLDKQSRLAAEKEEA